jgi:hypothetical protein
MHCLVPLQTFQDTGFTGIYESGHPTALSQRSQRFDTVGFAPQSMGMHNVIGDYFSSPLPGLDLPHAKQVGSVLHVVLGSACN